MTYLTPSEVNQVLPTGYLCGMDHQKLNFKTLEEAISYSKILSAKIILKTKKLGAKNL